MTSSKHPLLSLGIFFILFVEPLLVGLSVRVAIRDTAILQCDGTCNGKFLWMYITNNLEVFKCVQETCTEGEYFRSRASLSSEPNQLGNLSLILHPVVYNDVGWYEATCDSKSLCSVHLSVVVPTTVNASAQDDVVLHCYAHTEKRIDDGDVNFLWRKNDQMVLEVRNGITHYGSGFKERASVSLNNYRVGDLSLTLSRVMPSDNGLYHCSYNTDERGSPEAIKLNVTAPRSTCEKMEGDDLTLELFSLDWALVTFTGSEGAEMLVCSVKENTPTCYPKYKHRGSVRNSSLVLRGLSSSDTGTFTVKDEMNESISITNVTVKGGTNIYYYVAGGIVVLLAVVCIVLCIYLYRRKPQQQKQLVCFNNQQSTVVIEPATIEDSANIGLSQEETGRDSECPDNTHTPVEETTPMLETTTEKQEPSEEQAGLKTE